MIMDQALLQRRRRRARRRFCGFADLISGLSVDAPASLSFGVADQPISLFDFAAHNLASYSEDFTTNTTTLASALDAQWFRTSGLTVVDATNIQDASGSAAGIAQNITKIGNAGFVYLVRIAQEATYNATVLLNISDGDQKQVFFDPVTGDYEVAGISASSVTVTDVSGTHWDVQITDSSPGTSTTSIFSIYPAWGLDTALTNGATVAINSYFNLAASETLTVTRTSIQAQSAPSTYVQSTGASAGATASYGDIQFSDSLYDAADDNYVVTLSITSGDLTLSGTTGLTFTSGDGTSDASMVFSGTLENINTALRGLAIENASAGSATLVYKIVSNANGAILTGNIPVTVTAVATFLLLSDGTSYLLLSDGTSKLKLSA